MSYQTLKSIPSIVPERPYVPTYLWKTTHRPKAIIHIVHGMSEHAQRYHKLAEYLTSQGYHVVAHDHLGHGPLAKENKRLGYFGSHEADKLMISDMHNVYEAIHYQFPTLPYFILSHSMGSYLTRIYLDRYSYEIDGVMMSGTNSFSRLIALGSKLAPLLNHFNPKAYNYDIHRLIFQTGINEAADDSNKLQKLWHEDTAPDLSEWPLTGFVFTNNGFAELIKMVPKATRPGWLKNINRQMPIAVITGRNDPLVNKGKETYRLAKEFQKHQFASVTFYMFENRGHEILLYGGVEPVFRYVSEWFDNQL